MSKGTRESSVEIRPLIEKGQDAYRDGRSEEAADVFRRVLDADADNPTALLMLARSYRRLGQWLPAAERSEALLRRQPDHKAALRIAAEARGRLKQWGSAASHYRALSLLDSDVSVLFPYAQALSFDGMRQEAGEVCQRVLAVQPGHAAALVIALEAMIQKDDIPGSAPLWSALARADRRLVIRWARVLERQTHYAMAVQAVLGLSRGCGSSFLIADECNRIFGRLLQAAQRDRAQGSEHLATMAEQAAQALERAASIAEPSQARSMSPARAAEQPGRHGSDDP